MNQKFVFKALDNYVNYLKVRVKLCFAFSLLKKYLVCHPECLLTPL